MFRYSTDPSALLFLDCETTGLDPEQHEIFEIFYILRTPSGGFSKRHLWISIDSDKADPRALQVTNHAVRQQQVLSGEYKQRAPEIVSEIEAAQIIASDTKQPNNTHVYVVGINPALDTMFLNKMFDRAGLEPTWDHRVVDVTALAAGKVGAAPPWNIALVSEHCGISPPLQSHHDAETNVVWVMRMYDRVMSGALLPGA